MQTILVIDDDESLQDTIAVMLEQEGFQFGNHVDIFDAGPLVAAERARIRTIRDSRVATVRDIVAEVGLPETYLVSNGKLDFRCCLGNLRMAESADAQAGDVQVDLPRDIALTLGVRVGERVRYAPARPA